MHADGNTKPSSYVRYFILPCTSIFNTTHLRAYNLWRYLKYIFKTKNISYINLRYIDILWNTFILKMFYALAPIVEKRIVILWLINMFGCKWQLKKNEFIYCYRFSWQCFRYLLKQSCISLRWLKMCLKETL